MSAFTPESGHGPVVNPRPLTARTRRAAAVAATLVYFLRSVSGCHPIIISMAKNPTT